MMNKTHRIAALVGVVLMIVGLVTLLTGSFLPDLRALLMNISLIAFVMALGILIFLKYIRKQQEQESDENQE